MNLEQFDIRFSQLSDGVGDPPKKHPCILVELRQLADYDPDAIWPTDFLFVTLFVDAARFSDNEFRPFLTALMDQGCVVFDVVGQDAGRIHELYDSIEAQREFIEGDRHRTTITGSAEDEPLEESLWDSLFNSGPVEEYEEEPATWLFVVVDQPSEAARIRSLFADPEMKWAKELLSGENDEDDDDEEGDDDEF